MKADVLKPLSEKQFQAMVVQLARRCGWRTYHTHDSRRSTPGFPDLVLIRDDVIRVAELKVGNNRPSPEQKAWLSAFRAAGVPASIWRPSDWPLIEAALTR